MENSKRSDTKMNCPKCKKPMTEDPMFASGALSMITGSGKEFVNGGMSRETRMICEDCRYCEYVEVEKLPPMV